MSARGASGNNSFSTPLSETIPFIKRVRFRLHKLFSCPPLFLCVSLHPSSHWRLVFCAFGELAPTGRLIDTPWEKKKRKLRKSDPKTFLSTIDGGRKVEAFAKKKRTLLGDSSNAVFYIQKGKVKLTVVWENRKEATIGILNEQFIRRKLYSQGSLYVLCSATALADCTVMRIDKKSMMEVLHREHAFSDMFVAYLLTRSIRFEEDLVDHSSIPVRNDLLAFFSCLRISARTESPNL